jgi:hypothetical protein
MTKATVSVALVADRKNFQDAIYGTGIVWLHKGDVKQVPEDLWPRFAVHADVYALASSDKGQPDEPAGPAQFQADAKRAIVTPEQLEPMPDDAVRKEGLARGYKLHANLSAANLRARFIEQQESEAAASKPA